jgi:hypothetical protein
MNRLKEKAEKEIKKFDQLASQNPGKVEEYRSKVETLISEYNEQIAKLEKE